MGRSEMIKGLSLQSYTSHIRRSVKLEIYSSHVLNENYETISYISFLLQNNLNSGTSDTFNIEPLEHTNKMFSLSLSNQLRYSHDKGIQHK